MSLRPGFYAYKNLPLCPSCGAKAGAYCVTPDGHKNTCHAARRWFSLSLKIQAKKAQAPSLARMHKSHERMVDGDDLHDGWALCGCHLAQRIREREIGPIAPKRIVMGEGYPQSDEESNLSVVYLTERPNGECPITLRWGGEDWSAPKKFRLVLEVIE